MRGRTNHRGATTATTRERMTPSVAGQPPTRTFDVANILITVRTRLLTVNAKRHNSPALIRA
ncbi:hypothetical protein AWC32_15725 [Mycobacterium xenopi]|nr:hypothetical protein AWC32_15725 [Mycobacterium xenopi]SPX94929.1 Uncharacterised protein [Mycobacterium xenopi]